jgi:hypothetical protein
MDFVIGVSWPRSGHHLLVRLLSSYFGPEFRYCDYYGGIEGCCKSMPCTRAGEIHFTKSHDFDLDLPQNPGQKYLVQYRDYLHSVVSNYELSLLHQPPEQDTAENFVTFASEQFTGYRNFLYRWVESDFAKTQLLLSYDQLITYPKESLRLAVWWLDPETTLDEARIEKAVTEVGGERVEAWKVESLEGVGVHGNRDLSAFRHYNPALFAQLSQLTLTREEVRRSFKVLLGRAPAEKTYLHFQGLNGVEALNEALRASEEYRLRPMPLAEDIETDR